MNIRMLGRLRALAVRYMPVDGYDEQPDINSRGDLLIAQSLPPLTEIVRLGNSWAAINATAIAAVTALPTTAAQFAIWNGEPDGGKSFVIDSVFAIVTTSAGAAGNIGIAALLNFGPVAQPTAAAITVSSLNGRAYGGKAKFGSAIAVTDDKWTPVGNSFPSAGTSNLGQVQDVRLNGLYIVPPRHLLSLALLSINTTCVGKLGFRWHEVQMPVQF